MKPVRTWILIANGEKAFIVENLGPSQGLATVPGTVWEAPVPFEPADKQGYSFSSVGQSRHRMAPRGGPDHDHTVFARELAGRIAERHRKGEFDRLILCAAPEMLGQLRRELPRPVQEAVHAEIAKDITHVPVNALGPHLEEHLAV